MRRRTVLTGTLGLALLAGAGMAGLTALADDVSGPVYSGRDDGVAIKGADPVAYFTMGEAVQGVPEHSLEWNGRTWLFSSAEHKAAFEQAPEKYAPQYGGFCAYAAAQGAKVKIEPDAWSIEGGKLYLNYDQGVRSRWEKDKTGYIKAADERWPKIAAE